MRDVLASKWSLGVIVPCLSWWCGGCQQGPSAAAMLPSPATTVPEVSGRTPLATEPLPDSTTTSAAAAVSQSDVIGWTVRGVADDVIVDRIGRARSTFHLSAGEEVRLRDAGVSDDVIRAMKATAWD